MVPDFYYEAYSRQPRLWKKECIGGTGLMTKMKNKLLQKYDRVQYE